MLAATTIKLQEKRVFIEKELSHHLGNIRIALPVTLIENLVYIVFQRRTVIKGRS